MKIQFIEAIGLPDLWFQAIYNIIDNGERFIVDRGSYEGQTRLQYDYFIGHVKDPGSIPLIPDIPPGVNLPKPVEYEYIFGGKDYKRSYLEYLISDIKQEGESYTYGERLVRAYGLEKTEASMFNQIEKVIDIYKNHGHNNNQLILQIGDRSDLLLKDPPCLRHIDTKIQNNKLHFFVYFRSWDLWNGLPANLAAIQTLKEYMASMIGVDDGEMIVESKGLHLYGYAEKLAKIRCIKQTNK